MKPDRDNFQKAAEFYTRCPDGQYDQEAAKALECFFEMLDALKRAKALGTNDPQIDKAVESAEAGY